MNPYLIPFVVSLSTFAALPALALLKRHAWRRGIWDGVAFLLVALACYVVLLVGVYFRKSQLQWDLESYDLNGDGIFSIAEQSPGQQLAMAEAMNDTGISLAPFTGLFLAPLWVALWFGAVLIFDILRARKNA